jgi:hypothetical protein
MTKKEWEGSTGDPPVPVGDPPTGTSQATPNIWLSSLAGDARPIPSGESPDGTGQWPVLPMTQFPNTVFGEADPAHPLRKSPRQTCSANQCLLMNNPRRRRWTLRADNHGHYHSIVRLSECPLFLELHWRPTAVDAVRPVGVFRLDLDGLLRDRYIRHEPAGSHGPDVRVRVVRDDDGSFYVQTKRDEPRYLLASRAA